MSDKKVELTEQEKVDKGIDDLFEKMANGEGTVGLNAALEFMEKSTDDSGLRHDLRGFLDQFRNISKRRDEDVIADAEDKLFLKVVEFVLNQCGVMMFQGFKFGIGYADNVNAKKINDIVLGQLKAIQAAKEEEEKS